VTGIRAVHIPNAGQQHGCLAQHLAIKAFPFKSVTMKQTYKQTDGSKMLKLHKLFDFCCVYFMSLEAGVVHTATRQGY
jgi:hypothetical protein